MVKRQKIIMKVVLFLMLGIFIGSILQKILIPKWYYPDATMVEASSRILTGFYKEEKDSIEIITAGTSHMEFGYIPMEMYERYGVKSYNLATSVQPIKGSYFLLKEALKTQKVKIFVLDVSSLWLDNSGEQRWRYLLEQMPLSINKMACAQEFVKENSTHSIIDGLFPIIRYHDRWRSLSERDFTDSNRNKRYYKKGGVAANYWFSGATTLESMNVDVEELLEIGGSEKYLYKDGEYNIESNDISLYSVTIPSENLKYLLKIKELCDKYGVELLLTKVPAVISPIYYYSSWTKKRQEQIKRVCEENGLHFYEMLYGGNTNINWYTDSTDGGAHLNILGAQKITASLGEYLIENYTLTSNRTKDWDKSLETYNEVRRCALLNLEQDFQTYLNMLLNEYKDKTIFIVASEDMGAGLNQEDLDVLHELGLQTDFSRVCRQSFVAVIEDGTVTYEVLSNRGIVYAEKTKNTERDFCVKSYGYYDRTNAQPDMITIEGISYGLDLRGMNIVVYDDKRGLVLDSVCFNTSEENHYASRDYGEEMTYLSAFENYLIEVEGR